MPDITVECKYTVPWNIKSTLPVNEDNESPPITCKEPELWSFFKEKNNLANSDLT